MRKKAPFSLRDYRIVLDIIRICYSLSIFGVIKKMSRICFLSLFKERIAHDSM